VQGRRLLVPAVMLRDGQDVFLDDTTPAQLEKVLGATLIKTEIDGGIFLDTVMEYTESF
jgi:NifB/MoaA-like Fe-S oxidoreductase